MTSQEAGGRQVPGRGGRPVRWGQPARVASEKPSSQRPDFTRPRLPLRSPGTRGHEGQVGTGGHSWAPRAQRTQARSTSLSPGRAAARGGSPLTTVLLPSAATQGHRTRLPFPQALSLHISPSRTSHVCASHANRFSSKTSSNSPCLHRTMLIKSGDEQRKCVTQAGAAAHPSLSPGRISASEPRTPVQI